MSARVFDRAFAWQMTAGQADTAARLLADAAAARPGPVTHVIAVANGGMTPAAAIAARLSVPWTPVRARHNPADDLYSQATGNVTCSAPGLRAGSLHGRVLVVDDICGTGATLRAVTGALTPLAAPGTCFSAATLCRNAGARARPDLTVWDDLREWVIFPWEPPPPGGTPVRELPAPAKAQAA